ncbi:MAG: hypothetical protein HYY18_15650 [Planctomycetes bacterium]|nr:hypothetical protein [Planctomycetota bacterium]
MPEDIRRDLENLLGESEYGLLRNADPEELHARFPRAATRESLAVVEEALKSAEARGEAEAKRRLEALRAGVAWAWLRRKSREGTEEIEERFARADVRLPDGSTATVAAVRRMQEHAPDRETRRTCEEALAAAAAELAEDRLALGRRRKEAAQELGAKGVPELFARYTGVDPVKAVAGARRFLADTRDAHRENLDWMLKRHDGSIEHAGAHDLGWVRFDLRRAIPAPRDREARILEGAFKWMGLDPSAGGRLRRQAATEPPTTFARRKVPGEVYLSLYLEDGVPGWADTLRSWTRALCAAHTPAALPMEDRVLGDPAVPRAWAEVLHAAPFERDWIARVLDFAKSKDAARELQTLHLYATRLRCGLLEAELDLHAGAAPAALAERVTEATLVKHHAPLLLADLSPLLESAHSVRAAAAAASLSRLLETKFENWWRNPETGAFLVEAWAAGRRWPVEGLVEKLGAEEDGFGAMAKGFLARLA